MVEIPVDAFTTEHASILNIGINCHYLVSKKANCRYAVPFANSFEKFIYTDPPVF